MNTYIYVENETQKEVYRCYANSLQEADTAAVAEKLDLDRLEVSVGIGEIEKKGKK